MNILGPVRFYFLLVIFFVIICTNSGSQVAINELMPAPVGDEPEWLELFNFSDQLVDLINPKISNINTTKIILSFSIPPLGYAMVTGDTAKLRLHRSIPQNCILVESELPVLHNTFDPVVLRNSDNTVIDSVYYDLNWGRRGISFERIDWSQPATKSDNLAPSISPDSATAGYQNSVYHKFTPRPQAKRGSVLINEFLYDTDDNNSEFIELWNSTDDTINLNGWMIFDRQGKSSQSYVKILSPNFSIVPQNYVVIAWDSALFKAFPELRENLFVYVRPTGFSLNNTGDNIVLKNEAGVLIDSLSYTPDWHLSNFSFSKNVSIEKIKPMESSEKRDSWSSSGDSRGSTPCRENSLSKTLIESIELKAEPNPFSVHSSDSKPFCTISYKLPFRQAWIECKVYNPEGIIIKQIANNVYTSSRGELNWDGKDENGNLAEVGQYVLLLVASDIASEKVSEGKIVLVVGN